MDRRHFLKLCGILGLTPQAILPGYPDVQKIPSEIDFGNGFFGSEYFVEGPARINQFITHWECDDVAPAIHLKTVQLWRPETNSVIVRAEVPVTAELFKWSSWNIFNDILVLPGRRIELRLMPKDEEDSAWLIYSRD